jgi:hypothetical protein
MGGNIKFVALTIKHQTVTAKSLQTMFSRHCRKYALQKCQPTFVNVSGLREKAGETQKKLSDFRDDHHSLRISVYVLGRVSGFGDDRCDY